MADVYVEREQEVKKWPPARSVQITLTPEEAHLLGDFFGHLSPHKVEDTLHTVGSTVDKTYTITSYIYDVLSAEGLLPNAT